MKSRKIEKWKSRKVEEEEKSVEVELSATICIG